MTPLDTFLLWIIGVLLVLFAAATWLWRQAEHDLADSRHDLDVALGWQENATATAGCGMTFNVTGAVDCELVAPAAGQVAAAPQRPMLQLIEGDDR